MFVEKPRLISWGIFTIFDGDTMYIPGMELFSVVNHGKSNNEPSHIGVYFSGYTTVDDVIHDPCHGSWDGLW